MHFEMLSVKRVLIWWGFWMPTALNINGLVQERCNSIANILEFRLSCSNSSICMCPLCLGPSVHIAPITVVCYYYNLPEQCYPALQWIIVTFDVEWSNRWYPLTDKQNHIQWKLSKESPLEVVLNMMWSFTGLDINACPGHINFAAGHVNSWTHVPDRASAFFGPWNSLLPWASWSAGCPQPAPSALKTKEIPGTISAHVIH